MCGGGLSRFLTGGALVHRGQRNRTIRRLLNGLGQLPDLRPVLLACGRDHDDHDDHERKQVPQRVHGSVSTAACPRQGVHGSVSTAR